MLMETYTEHDLPRIHINYALHGKVMLCTGVVLFAVLLIILCFYSYARVFFRNRRLQNLRHRARYLLSVSTAATPTMAASEGLDPSVIETIPTFIYSAKDSRYSSLECAVCLSEFENSEKARVLPKCNHTFHVDCIDMWLNSHSDCPLCRAPVKADIPVNPPKTFEQTAVPVAEGAGSEPTEEYHIEMNISSATGSSSSPSSSSSPHLSSTSASLLKLESCPMKTLDLVGVEILVEVPQGRKQINRCCCGCKSG